MENRMILYEDRELIVCHKPQGVPVQSAGLAQKDMVSILNNYLAGKKEQARVNVVHRLDQPVEGVIVFAKTKRAAAGLGRQIQDGSMRKRYQAVCCVTGEGEVHRVRETAGRAAGEGDVQRPRQKAGCATGEGEVQRLHQKAGCVAGEGEVQRPCQKAGCAAGEGEVQRPCQTAGCANGAGNYAAQEQSVTLVDYLVKNGRTNTSEIADSRRKDAKRAELVFSVTAVRRVTRAAQKAEAGGSGAVKNAEGLAEAGGSGAVKNAEGLAEAGGSGAVKNAESLAEAGGSGKAEKSGSGWTESSGREAREYLLADIELKTGRHHQIRVQMAHAGMPLYGDRKYNEQWEAFLLSEEEWMKEAGREEKTQAGAGRNSEREGLALCAVSLCFRHPVSGKEMEFHTRPQGKAFRMFENEP